MDSLEFSAMSGSLVVRKNTSGDVSISTVPPVMITTNRPTVVAIGVKAVRDAIDNSNLKQLTQSNIVSVVA